MKIIESENIDKLKWDALVSNTKEASFFSYSWYMDACADNWCVIVDDAYSNGIALPYTKHLGVMELYTPVFIRYIELLGINNNVDEIRRLVSEKFENQSISCKQDLFTNEIVQFVYQNIPAEVNQDLGSQAKRMMKKAAKADLSVDIGADYKTVMDSISAHLKSKFEGINDKALRNMNKLLSQASKHGMLVTFKVQEGGIICLEKEDQVLYLKGAVSEELKKKGAMYLALNEAIQYAKASGKLFDFGGSRIEGVRNFNLNLGGTDKVYYSSSLGNVPYWFKFARRIKKSWTKKSS